MRKRDHPHDRYFRDLMEDIHVAKSFLKAYANAKVQEQINWHTLELYDTSLVGANNKQLYADVVYKGQSKAGEDIFLVLNHERKADRLLPIRRLEYKLGVLKKAIKQNKQPALIYFLTWYNGQEVPYPYAKSIAEYFKLSALAEELFLQDEIIVAKEIPDESMYNHQASSSLELFMKHSDNPSLLSWLVSHPAIAEKLTATKYVMRSLEYLADVGYHTPEDLLTTFEKVSAKLKETMLTTAQQLEQRGEQRGMQQEKLGIARNMLVKGYSSEVVTELTGLSREALNKLQANS